MVKLKLGHRRIQGRQGRLRFDGDMLIIALIGQHSTVDGEHLVVEIKHLEHVSAGLNRGIPLKL